MRKLKCAERAVCWGAKVPGNVRTRIHATRITLIFCSVVDGRNCNRRIISAGLDCLPQLLAKRCLPLLFNCNPTNVSSS